MELLLFLFPCGLFKKAWDSLLSNSSEKLLLPLCCTEQLLLPLCCVVSELVTWASSGGIYGARSDNMRCTQKCKEQTNTRPSENKCAEPSVAHARLFHMLATFMIYHYDYFCLEEEWVSKEKLLNWFVLLPAEHVLWLYNISKEIRHQEERWWTIFHLVSQLISGWTVDEGRI